MFATKRIIQKQPSCTTTDAVSSQKEEFTLVERKDAKVLKSMNKSSRSRGTGSSNLPPMLELTPKVSKTYRFQVQGASFAGAITVIDVIGALGGIASAATALRCWASCFKINKITVWPSQSSSTSASDVAIDWAAGESSQVPDEAFDVSLPAGITNTKALVFHPPKMSLAGFWITTADTSVPVFAFTALPEGSVVDLSVDFRLCNTIEPNLVIVSGATAGDVYYLALDGPTSNILIPTGMPTVA
jgi:hypothetical protein